MSVRQSPSLETGPVAVLAPADASGESVFSATPAPDDTKLASDGAGEAISPAESVFPVTPTPSDTTLALQERRAEQWARGERGEGSGGDGGGVGKGEGDAAAPVRAKLFGSDAEVAVTHEDLKGLVFHPPTESGDSLRDSLRHFFRGRHPLWWLLVGAVGTAAACVLFLLLTGRISVFKNWEDDQRAQIVELKRQAEQLAAAGRLQQAHDTYLQMDAVISGRPVRDPDLKRVVDAAHVDRRRVYDVLLERLEAARATTRGAAQAQAHTAHTGSGPPPATSPSSSPQPSTAPVAGSAPAVADAAAGAGQPGAATRSAPARRQRPPLQPVAHGEDVLTDEKIGRSIQRGVDWLLTQFDPRTSLVFGNGSVTHTGTDALAVYALLQCGFAIEDPRISIRNDRMRARIDFLKLMPMKGHHETYARGLRACALSVLNRREDLPTLRADAEALRGAHRNGAYTYQLQPQPDETWDNSNSQYGLLGVWSAVDAEPSIGVSADYWRAVEEHWRRTQLPDGQWGYRRPGQDSGGTLSMTSAGVASLFVAHDYLGAPPSAATPATAPGDALAVGRDPFSPALKKGLDWFERGDNAVNITGAHWGYTLYGIERVGLASGFKYFGKHDWYRVLAQRVVTSQQSHGAWGDGVVDTSFALLFLARGRQPVLLSKLRFDRADAGAASQTGTGFWANRPRDAANLARFTGRALERPLNWQVVNLDNEFQDWLDSPILYIASHAPPGLKEADYAKLRQFVDAGGMIFTHADASSPAFNQWAEQLPSKLSLPYTMADLPGHHLVHSIVFKTSPQPHLKAVSNGARLLVLHSPNDLSHHWQNREDRPFELEGAKRPAEEKARVLAPFHFGSNLFVYAAGKRDLRNRLDSPYVAPAPGNPVDVIPVARLEYAGNWDPEPGAWRRYSNWFHRQTGTKLDLRAVKLSDLKPDPVAFPFAHLTGAAPQQFTPEEVAALRAYVEAGGVVFADVCGGGPAFGGSLAKLLPQAFPGVTGVPVPPHHPMLNGGAPGMEDVSRPRVRLFNIEYRGVPNWDLNVLSAGRGHIVYSNGDAISGLLGTNTWGILGFEPKYAQSLIKNLIFWTVDGQAKPRE